MADTEVGLLPGERLLWTGRPARARVIPGDLIRPGLLLAALPSPTSFAPPSSPSARAPGEATHAPGGVSPA